MSTNGQDSYNQNHNRRPSFNPHAPASNSAPHNPTGSPPNTFPQYGAHQTLPFTAVPQGSFPSSSESFDRRRGPQSPVALNVPPRPVEQSRSGLDALPSPSEHPQWDNNRSGGFPHQVSQGHPRDYTDIDSSAKLTQPRPSYPYNQPQPPPPPPTGEPEFIPRTTTQYCRIPECRNKAFYDFAEQEQTEYCGQGHELQAISTGLVNRCAMCKGRPRRTGERVCSRTCRERERQAHQVQGSYYGVPVVRREPRTGPGALPG